MKFLTLLLILLPCYTSSQAAELVGIELPNEVSLADGEAPLTLNGAGIRKKFFFKIYVASLYLKEKRVDPLQIIVADEPKRMQMDMLYSKVDKAKFVEGWNEGFEANQTMEEIAPLRERLKRFNAMFETLVKGDRVQLDYLPGKGTRVSIKGVEKGVIPGHDFNQALLKVWLGATPVTVQLKKALLGQ